MALTFRPCCPCPGSSRDTACGLVQLRLALLASGSLAAASVLGPGALCGLARPRPAPLPPQCPLPCGCAVPERALRATPYATLLPVRVPCPRARARSAGTCVPPERPPRTRASRAVLSARRCPWSGHLHRTPPPAHRCIPSLRFHRPTRLTPSRLPPPHAKRASPSIPPAGPTPIRRGLTDSPNPPQPNPTAPNPRTPRLRHRHPAGTHTAAPHRLDHAPTPLCPPRRARPYRTRSVPAHVIRTSPPRSAIRRPANTPHNISPAQPVGCPPPLRRRRRTGRGRASARPAHAELVGRVPERQLCAVSRRERTCSPGHRRCSANRRPLRAE